MRQSLEGTFSCESPFKILCIIKCPPPQEYLTTFKKRVPSCKTIIHGTSVADQNHFDADPDLTFRFETDPDRGWPCNVE